MVEFHDEGEQLDTDEEKKFSVTIPPNALLLKVTLVWTDPPGEVLQNDLDLLVHAADGAERHGNIPMASSDFYRTNNV